jgi:hypothetical protein
MKNEDMKKIIRMLAAVSGILILVGVSNHFRTKSQATLADYAEANPEIAYMTHVEETMEEPEQPDPSIDALTEQENPDMEKEIEPVTETEEIDLETLPVSSTFTSLEEAEEYFYYEELSEDLQHYMTGISYPLNDTYIEIGYEDLRHVVVLHYNFEGEVTQGELICNQAIAQDLVEIFFELFRNEYQIEKIRLVDEYKADDVASMADNNTSCFNYRVIAGTEKLSRHALGMAVDINPLYNPYITYEKDGTENISPEEAAPYADRSSSFAYKIDEDDLAYKLFTAHGFTWGGFWNNSKDYQHFQK